MEQGIMNPAPVTHSVVQPNTDQRGVVLFIALIVMVVMSLAAVALIRSVDTTSAVIGNLAFRQAAILPANYAIEDAAAALFGDANVTSTPRIADVTVDDPTNNYYSTYDPTAANWDDRFGVPQPLQAKPASSWPRAKPDAATNNVTYVIERMCNPKAAVVPADKHSDFSWCELAPPKAPPGTTINDPMIWPNFKQPYYRVTVRVDGPPGTNTVSFVQAMLR
jgi:Tfp pilus assembly protein PilX